MKNLFILLILIVFVLGCSKDDGPSSSPVTPTNIEIVNADGSLLIDPNCVTSLNSYAIKITTTADTELIETTNIGFTVNGVVFNMIFNEEGSDIVPINLTDGINTVQLIDSGVTNSSFLIAPPAFEIVP